jgi:hypothetical protein
MVSLTKKRLAYLSIDPLDNKQVILVKEMILKNLRYIKVFKADIDKSQH